MKIQFLFLNLIFLMAIASLHLPILFNGKHASLLAIIYTILADNLGLENLNTLSIIVFLLPIYFFYLLVFSKTQSNILKTLICVILVLAILPFGAMLPPR
jgi:hypothetical protein